MNKPLRDMTDSELRRHKHAAQRVIQDADRELKHRRERKKREQVQQTRMRAPV